MSQSILSSLSGYLWTPPHRLLEVEMTSRLSDNQPPAEHPSIPVPGILSALLFPYNFACNCQSLINSFRLGEIIEKKVQSIARFCSLPLSAAASLTSIVSTVSSFDAILKPGIIFARHIMIPLAMITPCTIAGAGFGAIEAGLAMSKIKRQDSFLKAFKWMTKEHINAYFGLGPLTDIQTKIAALTTIKDSDSISEGLKTKIETSLADRSIDLSTINNLFADVANECTLGTARLLQSKYIEVNAEEAVQLNLLATDEADTKRTELLAQKHKKLDLCASPGCAARLKADLPRLIEEGNTEQLRALLNITEIQAKKSLFFHRVSTVLCIGFTLASIAALCACPPIIPAVMFLAIGVLFTMNCMAYSGSINQEGWTFCPSDCLPGFIQRNLTDVWKDYKWTYYTDSLQKTSAQDRTNQEWITRITAVVGAGLVVWGVSRLVSSSILASH